MQMWKGKVEKTFGEINCLCFTFSTLILRKPPKVIIYNVLLL